MRRDHRPYALKKLYRKFEKFYVNHYLRPQFDSLGKGAVFMKPWHTEIFGAGVRIGDYPTVIAAPDRKVRFAVWSAINESGNIHVGNYCLLCPGVRIGAAKAVNIADNCMIASGAYITDSDWHDIYNRISMGTPEPVHIEENVWIGDQAIICKGVRIGKNSVIGAGSVVTRNIPRDTVAAGNPARVLKNLDPNETMVKRSQWFSDPLKLSEEFDRWDREMLKGNSLGGWIRHLLFPEKGD
ncbi:MAG: acyltransferase [Desulfococcaceae bacterium]|nr:acyltransferase [Desulfococcaceae bacterium]